MVRDSRSKRQHRTSLKGVVCLLLGGLLPACSGDSPQEPFEVPLRIRQVTLGSGIVGSEFLVQLTVSGGSGGPYSWSIVSGELPPGLSLSETGVISGVPTVAGYSNVFVRVADGGKTATTGFDLNIWDPPIAMLCTARCPNLGLPDGVVDVPYYHKLRAMGGTGTYTWSIPRGGGELPAGLSLSPDGVISGTPTVVGSAKFSLEVVSGRSSSTRPFTIQIVEPPKK